MSIAISGTGVSRGIAIGKVHRLEQGEVEVYEAAIPKQLVEDEVARFRRAVRTARQQLKAIRNSIPETTRMDISDFIDTHLLMMEDSMLTAAPVEIIREHQCNAEWALKSQRDALAAVFEEMDDPYLRTRKDDVDHVVTRIQRILTGQLTHTDPQDNEQLRGAIVVAHDLTPAETALLHHRELPVLLPSPADHCRTQLFSHAALGCQPSLARMKRRLRSAMATPWCWMPWKGPCWRKSMSRRLNSTIADNATKINAAAISST